MSKNIAIIGCGWLGLPLAKALRAEGHNVNGSTTSEEKLGYLKNEGIHPFLISLSEKGISGPISDFLAQVEILIINVPPRLRGKNKEHYVSKIRLLLDEVEKSTVKKVVFASSTSVYGDLDGDVDENTVPKPVTASGIQLLECEKSIRNSTLDYFIVRFAGLIGPDRHPVTILSGKEHLTNGNAPVNLVHLDDCIGLIQTIVKSDHWQQTLNAVYPLHPSKEEYYTLQAKKRGLIAPKYAPNSLKSGKKINTSNTILVNFFDFNTSIM